MIAIGVDRFKYIISGNIREFITEDKALGLNWVNSQIVTLDAWASAPMASEVFAKNIAGVKCDYYFEGVRTFRFDDGDFVTYKSKDEWKFEKFIPLIFKKHFW